MIQVGLRRAVYLLGGVAASAIVSGQAWGQEQTAQPQNPSEEATGLDDIIVTAMRRSQSVQDVPAAIAVLTNEDLRQTAAQDIRDYVTTVPGMTYAEDNTGNMRVTVRGIADGISGGLTAIYIDEAPVTGTGLDPDIYDVAQVEVLKGPQGTLYGGGSMGGTVRIMTTRPRLDVFEGSIAGTLNTTEGGGTGGRLDGVVNLPVVADRLALRVSAGYRDEKGWIDNIVTGEENTNTLEKHNVRAQLLYAPGPDTSIILGILHQSETRGAPSREGVSTAGRPLDRYQTVQRFRESGDSNATLASFTLQQDFEGVNLTSATNYLERTADSAFAVGFSRALVAALTGVQPGPDDAYGLNVPYETKQFTQEVRLASTGENRLDWLVGAFYSDVSTTTAEHFNLTQAPTLNGVITGEEFFYGNSRSDVRQIAGFGELTYNFSDTLSATIGLRAFDVQDQNVVISAGLLADGDSTEILKSETSSTTTKFAVQYQPSREHLIYAQAAEGFRNGGANSAIPASCGAALAEAGYASAPGQYGSDSLWNYEIGTKNTFLGGRAKMNAALFHIDWSNMQSTVGLGDCGHSFTANTGSAVSKGVEIDASLWVTDALSVNVGVSRLDAELTSVGAGAAGQEGDSLPFAPKWSWNANARYDWTLSNGLTAYIRGDVNYVGSRYTDFQSVERAELLEDYTTLGARIALQNDRWEISVFGTNLTDEHVITNVIGSSRQVTRPRTIGVGLRSTF